VLHDGDYKPIRRVRDSFDNADLQTVPPVRLSDRSPTRCLPRTGCRHPILARAATDRASSPARSGRGSGSRPSHHLELRRAGGGQAVTDAIDVRCRDVDAQQHGALRDLSLQGFGRFLW
jgi:hypothetical protein